MIAQISDTHILAKSSDRPEAATRAENLRRCVADINRQRVDAVIHTGDSVHDGLADEYDHLREILSALEPPLFLVPGNRDRHEGLRVAFPALSRLANGDDHLRYAVEDYPIRLIALDSAGPGERKGVFGPDRLAWLDAMLAREPAKPAILFLHHPPFDVAPDYRDGYRRGEDAESLAATVSRHPQVKRLLCGHVHRWHSESWAGTRATTMPSVAVDLRKGVAAEIGAAPVYMLHSVSPDGSIVSRQCVA